MILYSDENDFMDLYNFMSSLESKESDAQKMQNYFIDSEVLRSNNSEIVSNHTDVCICTSSLAHSNAK